jgi:acyl-CoA synthetase (AMP-forming)/AMP-acid ligase II
VGDGLEGFPESYLNGGLPEVEMKIEEGSLRIRSPRTASAYAGRPDLVLVGSDGYVDTGDMIEIRNGRCYFTGRRGGIINVGGLKVHPEEIEAVINRHPNVRLSWVKSRKSPIIGAIVVAEVVLNEPPTNLEAVKSEIVALCRLTLTDYKIPAMIKVVENIETTAGGKLVRSKI